MTDVDPNRRDEATPGELSDHSLLRRLKQGEQDAATQLYLRYAQRLLALARSKTSTSLSRRVDSDEIVQSVFGSFFRGAQQGYYDVPVGEELWKLFLVIALNKIRAKGAFHLAAKRDVPVIQACGLVFAMVFVLLNTLADVLVILVNPRLRHKR